MSQLNNLDNLNRAFSYTADSRNKKRKIGIKPSAIAGATGSKSRDDIRVDPLIDILAPTERQQLMSNRKIKELDDWLNHVFTPNLKFRVRQQQNIMSNHAILSPHNNLYHYSQYFYSLPVQQALAN